MQRHLGLRQVGEVHEHQQVLHRVVEHGVEFGRVNLGHGGDGVAQRPSNLRVAVLLAVDDLQGGRGSGAVRGELLKLKKKKKENKRG